MKKFLFNLVLMLALCVPWAHGQTPVTMTTIVADGTSTSCYVPVFGYYCDAINVSQVIYPASELADLTNGDVITALHFYLTGAANTGKWDASTFEVRLANTTQDNLSSSFDQTASTLVYSGFLSATSAAGMTVTFTTPFTYTGGNLLIQFAQPRASNYSTTYFYGKDATGAGRYKSGSASITSGGTADNILPKCQITYQTIPRACYPLQRLYASDITRTSLTANWTKKATATNCVGYEVKISTSNNPDDADISTAIIDNPATTSYTFSNLERNTTYYIHARSNCGEEDGYSEWVSTSATTKSLNECNVIGNGTSTVSGVPAYSSYGNTYSQQIFTAEELTAAGVLPGAIEGISYTWNQSSSYTKHLTIFLGHTTKESFSNATDWESASVFTQYYDDDAMQVTGAGTVNYTFTTPFVWDGESNIIIATIVGQTTGGSSTGSTGFLAIGTTCSVNRSCYMYEDSYEYGIDPFVTSAKSGGGATTGRANVGFCQTFEACPAVTNVTVSDIAQTTANLSWTASTGDYANTYDVLVRTTPVGSFLHIVPTYVNLETCGLALTDLEQYTDYYVYVRVKCNARDHTDGEAWSEAVQFKTLSNCITPTDFTVTPLTKTSAKAQWTATSQTSNYRYILSTEELFDPDIEAVTASGITRNNVLLNRLTPGETYYLYLSNACGGEDGNSPYISTSFTMPDACIAPANVYITDVQKYQMTLNWTPSPYADATDAYDIIVSDTAVTDFTGVEPTYEAVTGSSKVLDLLHRNTTYYIYMRTNCGEDLVTDWSAAVSESTLGNAPDCENTIDVIVADGTETGNATIPLNGYNCDSKQKSQTIYPASELVNLYGKTIQGVKYFVASGGSSNSSSWENGIFTISMAITTQNNLGSGWDNTPLTAVYTGKLKVRNSEMTIVFDTPFEYTGGNLLVDFQLPISTGWASCNFVSKSAANASRYITGNLTGSGTLQNYLPKVAFMTCSPVENCPAVDAPIATDVTNNSATITWNAGTGDFATSYDLVVSETPVEDFTGVTLAADDVPATSFAASGLTPNTLYYAYVRVNCVNEVYDDGSSLWSPAGEFTTELACLKPENFVAGSPLSDRVELSWIKKGTAVDWKIVVDTVDYTIWEYVHADTIDVNIAACTVVEDTVTYLLTGLQPLKSYTLALQADCGETDSLSKFATNTPSFATLNNNTEVDTMTIDITSAEVFSYAIDRSAKTINFVVRKGSDLEEVYGEFITEDGYAKVKFNGEDFIQPWNLSAPVTVTVLAQDTTISADWTIIVTEEPCATPFNVAATDIERRTANLTWNIGDASTSFDFVISETELEDPATGSIQNITATNVEGACTYAITGLTRETHYYVYLRTNCGETFGQWRGTDFTTKSLLVCDEETIADGTNTSAYFPFYGYYQDTKGTESQFIYGSDMLTELRGKSISKMTFYSLTSSLSFTGTNRVSIGITSDDSFSGAFKTSPSHVVFTGNVSISGGQHTIVFDAPFEYPAEGGNLLIEYLLTETGNYPSVSFYGINTSNYAGRCRTSNYNFLPKVTFEACASTDACPEVTNVAIADIAETSATVTWTESTGDYANTSDIYYSTTEVEDFTGVEPQVTGVTGNSAEITGLANYTIYYVYVRTHCDGEDQDDGISNWAGGTSFRTLSPCRVPGTPVATITGKHTATVTWTNTSEATQADNFTYIVSNMPIAEEDLVAGAAPFACGSCWASEQANINNTTVDLTDLASETTYYFYVKNVCTGDVNCSSPWDSCQFTMPAAMPAVINLQTYDIASNAFTAVWESDLANFANETAWEVACVADGETPTTWTTVTEPEYFAIGLTPETSYDFYVRAVDGENYSANAKADVTTTAVPEDCQEFVAGTTTVTNAPMHSNYGGSYSVLIYTAEELAAQGYVAGDIEKISFYQTSCGNTTTVSKYQKTTTVWMGNTAKSSFSSSSDWLSGLTQVMNPTPVNFNKVNDWVDMNLDQAFTWDGTSNIAVAVLAYSSSYTTMAFRGGSSSSDNVSICSYKDATNWTVTDGTPSITSNTSISGSRPNIKFCFAPEACRSVTNLVVDNITATSARAHWYPGATETEWQVINSTEQLDAFDAFDALATGYATVTDPQITYTDLIKDMDYYFYVRGVCDDETTSRWMEYHYMTLPSCSAPATAVATSEADNSITFTVTSGEYGTEGTYDYRYWIVGSNDQHYLGPISGDTTTVTGQASELTVTDLAACVDYAWEVRANCSGEDEGASRWVAGNNVHVCGKITLPYSESFETVPTSYSGPGMIETICWNDLNAGATSSTYPYYNASTSYATDGSKTLQFHSSSTTPIYMILPEIADATQCQVKFDCAYSSLTYPVKFQVGYITDPTDATTFVPSFTDNPTATYSMQTRVANLFNIPEGARIAICYSAISTNVFGWLDNVSVDTIPYYNVATAVAPELTPAIGSIEVAYNEDDILSEGVFYGGTAPIFTAVPNEGIEFINWTNANNGDTLATVNPWTINIAQDTAIVANFDTASFNLYVLVAPGYDIYGEVTGGGNYPYGRTINYSAAPMEHYSVVWPDGSKENNRSIEMPSYDTTIVATFEIDKHQLTVALNDSTMGTVTGTGVYDYGTFVDITATPNDPEHMIFTGWSNGETDLNITIDLQHDSTVVANFIWVQYNITAIPVDTLRGTVTGGGVYNYGDTATLIAVGKFPYQFSRWDDDNLTELDTFKVKVLGDATYTAYFKYNEFDVIARSADVTMGTVTGGGSYVYDTIVNITAIPNEHYHFVRWDNGSVDPVTAVVVRGDTMLTAYFAIDQHAVVAQVNNTDLGSVAGAGTYDYGAEVTLTATAAAHAVFANWSNGETANPLTFTLAGDTTVTAIFVVDTHAVAANVNDPTMGTVTGAGNYAHGTMATLTATANEHYHFVNWNNGIAVNTFSILVEQDTTVTANFAIDQHVVVANVNNSDLGSVTGAGTYNYGASVILNATAAAHAVFTGWSNGETANPLTFTLAGDTTVTAIFVVDTHAVALNVNDDAMGSVTGAGDYAHGSNATFSATANYGYHFAQWNDGNTDNPRTVVVTDDASFTAQFAANSYNVAAVSDNNVMGSVAGAGSYTYNTPATITATANYGYHFTQWSDGNTTNPRTLTVICDTSFTAQFATNDYVLTVNGDEVMGSATGAGSYAYNTLATISATANYGYHFTQWNDGNTANPRTLIVTCDSAFTAQFAANNYNVAVMSANSVMGSVDGAGSYTYNTSATISATANYGYHFTQWSDGNTVNPRTLTVTCDSIFIAQFAVNTYNLTLLADEVMGSVAGAGDFEYNASTMISASANYGYHFTGWSDGVTLNPRMVTVTKDSTITALFAANAYHVSTSVNIDEAGSVSGAADYQYLEQAILTATATPCYHFVGWNDGVSDNPRTIVVESDTAFAAIFELNVYESEFSAVACDSYSWDEDTYTISGDYTHVYPTVNGCDSTVTLHLTVNYSDEGEFSDQASDLYIWDGREYTESGDYTFVYQNVYGCDSTMTLHLTIANFPTPLIKQVNNRALMVNHYPYANNEYVDYADYRWYRNGELVASGSDNYLEASGLLNGCYTVEVPTNAEKTVWVHSNELCFQNGVLVGIEDADAIEISFTVAPNPVAKGAVMTISTELPEHMLQGATLTMFDLSGRIITSMPMTQQSVSMTADQASGVYMIQIMTRSGEKQVKKVIVR